MAILIDSLTPDDWEAARKIYIEGILTGNATFETEPPTWEKWDVAHLPAPRLAARLDIPPRPLLGWAALSPVSTRPCYRGVAEVSLYVAADWRGQGIGRTLLAALVEQTEQSRRRGRSETCPEIWTLQASILVKNEASIHLHLSQGFRLVGRRERIAQLHGAWRDTVLLERRING